MRLRGMIIGAIVAIGVAVAVMASTLSPLATVTAQTNATSTPPLLPGGTTPGSVTYAAGWQIVGLPQAMVLTGNSGPLYTFKAGDTGYTQVASGTPLTGGVGYWAFFGSPTTITLTPTTQGTATATATATATSTATATTTSTATATATGTATGTATATATCGPSSPGNSCAAQTCPFGTVSDPDQHGECVSAAAHQLNGTATATGTQPGSTGQQPLTIQLGVGWTMIGNPFFTASAQISGAVDVAYAYNLLNTPGSGYQAVCSLPPGFGAVVFSSHGGTLTLTPQSSPLAGAGGQAGLHCNGG